MSRISGEDLLIFNETLRSAAAVGAPLPEGLLALAREMGSAPAREAVEKVAADLRAGMPLSEALGRKPEAFSPLYVRLVLAGEKAGSLEAVLRRVSAVERETLRLRGEIREALVYPLFVCLAIFGVIFVLSNLVMPVFSTLISDMDIGNLPWLTRHGIWLMPLPLLPMLVLAWLLLRPRKGGTFLSAWEEKWIGWIPLVGGLVKVLAASRFCHAAGLLLERGVPAPEAIRLASEASGSARMVLQAPVARELSEQGGSFTDALPALRTLPDTVLWICKHGERRGDLAGALDQLGRLYLDAALRRMRILRSLATPAFVLLTFPAAAITAWSVFLPLVNLMDAISGS